MPPLQPEQDACNALQLCGTTFFTPYSYTGTGKHLDLDETPCFKGVNGGETNSVWLQLKVSNAGSINFKIEPVDPQDDYDFAVINATGKDCGSLTSNDVVRCNYNNNILGSNVNGIIGLSDTSRTPYIQKNAFGGSFAQSAFARADETYYIMINNNGNYVSGGPSKGFTIDFSGSTATFYNPTTPQISSIDVPCTNSNSIVLRTNVPILCNSIAADGSDFITDAPAKIISASGVNCNSSGGYTNLIQINFSSVLPSSTYTINSKNGTDNNTLVNLCGDELPDDANPIQFIINTSGKIVIDNENVCYQQLPFKWHGLELFNNDSGRVYTTKSSAGCDSTTILNLHVSAPPQQVSMSETICDGDAYVLPWDSTVNTEGTYVHHFINKNGCDSLIESISINVFTPGGGNVELRDSTYQTGFCQNGLVVLDPGANFKKYLWNTGETSSYITVNIAGAYSLIAKDNFGCTTIDTFVVAAYSYPVAAFQNTAKLCVDSSVVLDAGSDYTFYLWNNGSRAQTISTNTTGKFWVTLTNTHGCTATDTVTVVQVNRPANFLMSSVTKCSFKVVTLSPEINFADYAWNNGNTTKSTTVENGGLYWLKVTDENGCTGRDSITVIDSICPRYFYIASAFTPNNDGLNDIFKPSFSGPLTGYHFKIYNRWGKLIFSSDNGEKGWDGTVNGFQQPIGAYIWTCTYSLDGQSPHAERGTVTLLR